VVEVVLALGSNLGDRAQNLRSAVECLRGQGVEPERASSIWDTPPFPEGQPRFYNAVLVAGTELRPRALLRAAKSCEVALGRTATYRWGPRVIDVDVLFYGDERLESEDLVVPHPRISERAFVLAPLAEVCVGVLPVIGETASALLARVDREGVARTKETLLPPRQRGSDEVAER
jgi:2-amino-4-hydroxy-6-hydroxymethyldihydropteridine diphosphokinase